jgi:hypothetical protein
MLKISAIENALLLIDLTGTPSATLICPVRQAKDYGTTNLIAQRMFPMPVIQHV